MENQKDQELYKKLEKKIRAIPVAKLSRMCQPRSYYTGHGYHPQYIIGLKKDFYILFLGYPGLSGEIEESNLFVMHKNKLTGGDDNVISFKGGECITLFREIYQKHSEYNKMLKEKEQKRKEEVRNNLEKILKEQK